MKKKSIPKIIIDTDPGHDDALAIMFLVKSGMFDIKALTTVAGNSTIENVTRNATYILNLLGKDIPIYSGYPNPLERRLVQAVVHGKSGLDGVDTSETIHKLTGDAPDQIIKLVRSNKNQLVILAIGPLSNIARAFIKDPKLPSLIKQLVIMGGAINVPGNKNRVAEFNMFVDPEAADIVFLANVRKVLVPFDVCSQISLSLPDLNGLKRSSLFRPIMDMMKEFAARIEKYEGVQKVLVPDAVAAYYFLNPKAFKLQPMDIVIETKGDHTFGMTVVEKRAAEKKMYNVDVVTKLDRETFMKDFIRILKE